MKVIWSDFVSKILNEIYSYHKEIATTKIAMKIKKISSHQQNCY